MYQVRTQVFTVNLGSFFAQAIPFSQVKPELLAGRLTQKFSSVGLRPTQIQCREGDHLFDYDLTFTLFNRNATCRIAADKVEAAFQNGRDPKDANVVRDSILSLLETVADRHPAQSFLEVGCHAALGTKEDRDQILAKFGNPAAGIPAGGVVAYVPHELCGEIRFLLERSNTAPEAVFMSWTTQAITKLTADNLTRLLNAGRDIAAKFDISFGT
jgi:hypothetical protein